MRDREMSCYRMTETDSSDRERVRDTQLRDTERDRERESVFSEML